MYCNPEELDMPDVDGDKLLRAIESASEKIDRWTGQWFEPRERDISMSGYGGSLLHLYVPALAIHEAHVNEQPIAPDAIRIAEEGYCLVCRRGWDSGRHNVLLKGSFGFERPPMAIQEACVMLARRNLMTPDERKAAGIVSETTDGHSYTLSAGRLSTASWSGDPEIDELLVQYMAPVKVGMA